ncbi:hypothetical protein PIB30_029632 [Stylosanthes scabra]|uniref:Uncharacterized protein n=1 Tax=Stylosanthes scabra TaxID=79078 RepID=A0ABU6RBT2_9FABA|nr:hypothetical protein [Stylosanthes scabra]
MTKAVVEPIPMPGTDLNGLVGNELLEAVLVKTGERLHFPELSMAQNQNTIISSTLNLRKKQCQSSSQKLARGTAVNANFHSCLCYTLVACATLWNKYSSSRSA